MMQRTLLIFILVLAVFLRLIGLGRWPESLYWEEVALGYDAYSIWQTGKDYHGHSWPIVAFESFGDYKPSGYFYAAAPFVGLLGLNNWSIRLPSAIAGIVTVYLVYLLGTLLFKNKKVGLWSALTLAILPWHIQFSRAAFEVNLAVMWMILGVVLLLKAIRRPLLMWFATISFVLAAYTYHGLRITGPLIALLFVVINFKKLIASKWLWVSGLTAVVLMLPLLVNLTNPVVSQRFKETSLFSTSEVVLITNQLRAEDGNTLFSRLLHHRYLYWGKEILTGISDHFSFDFLFFNGDGNLRHQTGYTALLYLWQIVPIGISFLFFSSKQKRSIFVLLFWLLLSALPAALTNLTPHTLRFLPAAPAFALLTGYGMHVMLKCVKGYFSVLVYLIIAVSLFFYGFDYVISYPKRSAFEWQIGYKEMIEYVQGIQDNYPHVQITRTYGRPSIYLLYFMKIDPKIVQEENSLLSKDQGELLEFSKYRFGSIDPTLNGLAVSETTLTYGSLLETIATTGGRTVFYIYEI